MASRESAEDTFGPGTSQITYLDEGSGGTITMLERPDGKPASVLELLVPEAERQKGVGARLQAHALQMHPNMMGQVSSRYAAKSAYDLGRRPFDAPDATLEDVYKLIEENSSVNLISQAPSDAARMLDEAVVNQPIDKIPFIHNTEPNPLRNSDLYGTNLEPAGQYVTPISESYLAELRTNMPSALSAMTVGEKSFKNPLVIRFGSSSYDAPDNWKQVLHQRYGNKSGMDLNEAIRSDGYDGIVTVDENGNLSEIVDLTVGKSNSMLRAMNQGGIIERKDDNRTYI